MPIKLEIFTHLCHVHAHLDILEILDMFFAACQPVKPSFVT
jgi:hypothetical protein